MTDLIGKTDAAQKCPSRPTLATAGRPLCSNIGTFWELFAAAKKKMARYDRKDSVYRAAKKAGLRSRAGLKLEDIDKRFHIFRRGHKVLDLGCWPGAWLQIASKAVGDKGRVVGIDLVETSELDSTNVFVVTGDVRDSAVIDGALEVLGGSADVVLSDMAPKLTGVRASDQARHLDLAEAAVDVAKVALKPGGVMVLKLFSSVESEMTAQLKAAFASVDKLRPPTTRRGSSEIYAVAAKPRR